MEHIERLLSKFQAHNVTLNFDKSNFFPEEVGFLGYILNKERIKPHPDKTRAIREYPRPRNIKQLFFDLINFYSRFTHKYAHNTIELLKLIKKGTKWRWE